ncbi:MAG: hypothetical protein MPJ50_18335 [Pirellulales bacterium]|nr:hypothetical protein [Pirellulales bacterium]
MLPFEEFAERVLQGGEGATPCRVIDIEEAGLSPAQRHRFPRGCCHREAETSGLLFR